MLCSENCTACYISLSTINNFARWLFQKTLYCSNHRQLFAASVTGSIKTHDKENIQQMFSTRFFNRGLMVIYHKTQPPHLHRVEMATIVTYRHTIHTTGLSFDLQPDILDL